MIAPLCYPQETFTRDWKRYFRVSINSQDNEYKYFERKEEIDEESHFSSITFFNVCVRPYPSLFLVLSHSGLLF